MLKKRIRKLLQRCVLGNDADKFVTDIFMDLPARKITERVEYVSVQLNEGDVLVFPSSISDEDFKSLSSLATPGKRILMAAADNVSVIKLS